MLVYLGEEEKGLWMFRNIPGTPSSGVIKFGEYLHEFYKDKFNIQDKGKGK